TFGTFESGSRTARIFRIQISRFWQHSSNTCGRLGVFTQPGKRESMAATGVVEEWIPAFVGMTEEKKGHMRWPCCGGRAAMAVRLSRRRRKDRAAAWPRSA